MFDELNKNSLLKSVVVIVIGLFAVNILLNFISGGSSMMGYSGNMAGGGHAAGTGGSFTGLLSSLLMLLVQLLMILLVIVVVLGIVAWVKETFFKNNDSQLSRAINNDPVIKSAVVVTLAIFGLVIISALFGNFMSGPGFGMGYNMGGYGGMQYGFNPGFSIVSLLTLLIRILTFILILSLILAVVIYLKKQFESGNLNFFGESKAAPNSTIVLNTTTTPAENNTTKK